MEFSFDGSCFETAQYHIVKLCLCSDHLSQEGVGVLCKLKKLMFYFNYGRVVLFDGGGFWLVQFVFVFSEDKRSCFHYGLIVGLYCF